MKSLSQGLVVLIYAGIIYTLVRPNSQGPLLVTNTTNGLANLLQSSMGKGQNW